MKLTIAQVCQLARHIGEALSLHPMPRGIEIDDDDSDDGSYNVTEFSIDDFRNPMEEALKEMVDKDDSLPNYKDIEALCLIDSIIEAVQ